VDTLLGIDDADFVGYETEMDGAIRRILVERRELTRDPT
jgi:hypothetical protein